MSALIIRPVSPFAAATLIPIPLLALGGLFGGIFILAAVLYMTVLRMVLDRLIATAGPEAGPGSEFPAAEQLSRVLAWAHFPLLAVGVAGLSGATGLGFWEGLGVLLAFGLYFGQVSNSNAHELIHRTDKGLFRLGKWVLISLLYGHHVTAHLKVHHRYVATPDDPNTARLGEGFWGFTQRAWAGAFVAGWEIERSIAKVKERELPLWRHPYAEYVAGGLGFALLATVTFGASGLIAYLMLAGYAQLQLLLSDYVQHYGLRRRRIGDERYEQVAPWHSWNAAHWFSGGLMLNAPRHSEHHTNPARPFPELSLPATDEGPRLPFSLPVMGAVALVPPLWRGLMDRRAAGWQRRIDEGKIERRAPPPLLPAPEKPVWPLRKAKAEAEEAAETAAPPAEAALAEMAELAEVVARSKAEAGAPGEALPGPHAAPGEAEAGAPEEVSETTEAAALAGVPEERTGPEEAAPAGREDEAAQLMRRLEETEAALGDEPAAAPPPQRPDSGARTPQLWAEKEGKQAEAEPEPEEAPEPAAAPTFRTARSAALFQPDEPSQPAEAPAEPEPEEAPEPAAAEAEPASPEAALEAAVADLIASGPKPPPRGRMLPSIEPEKELGEQPSFRERARRQVHGAALAARALAALLRGAPPAPLEEEEPPDL
jgi:alkane 1-monooxygenase